MKEVIAASAMVIFVVGILIVPMVCIYLQYKVWWHRWRNHDYRVIQLTVVASHDDDPVTHYIIQKKRLFRLGWKSNPEIPGYDRLGNLHLYATHPYKTLDEAKMWMDRIVAIKTDPGKSDVVY